MFPSISLLSPDTTKCYSEQVKDVSLNFFAEAINQSIYIYIYIYMCVCVCVCVRVYVCVLLHYYT